MTNKQTLKGIGIGVGYFSHYQYDSWNRIPNVTISAIANRTRDKAEVLMPQYNIVAITMITSRCSTPNNPILWTLLRRPKRI